ncbi:MAG: hypothetical protein H6687_02560 [Bacillales bacterium]|nr:hypothetical protein [Bacillales bacterium]
MEKNEKKHILLKTLSWITFILACVSVIAGIIICAVLMFTKNIRLTYSLDFLAFSVYPMFFVLPVPVLCFIIGLIDIGKGIKYKKNVIIGGIMSYVILEFLLIIPYSYIQYSHAYSNINLIGDYVDVTFPENGYASMYIIDDGTGSSDYPIHYIASVLFTDGTEIYDFETSIRQSSLWINDISDEGLALITSTVILDNYNYYLLYNFNTGRYNSFPYRSGTYDYIFLAYSVRYNALYAISYTKTITIQS